ncbi:MAG: hypothetical protein PHC86_05640, partial [Eubacteriales bacterium]|nr:hypothetical protein [Eubacteriales bacterium]
IRNVKTFDQFQRDYLNIWLHQPENIEKHRATAFFKDTSEEISRISRASQNEMRQMGDLSLYSDRLEFHSLAGEMIIFPLLSIGMITVHGPQTLQFQDTRTNEVFEVNADRPRSAYRYWVMVDLLKRILAENTK